MDWTTQNLLALGFVEFFLRNWALFAMVGTLCVLYIVPAMILRKYVKIIRNILDDMPLPFSMSPRDFERVEGVPVDFRSFDGHGLSGMIVSGNPQQSPRGFIIFAHEYASDGYSCARYCKPLLDAGYDVLTFDFRGHGQSTNEEGYKPRQWASDREQADMEGAIAFAKDYLERKGLPVELGLFGISRGGCAAIMAAVDVPGVKAILTDGAFSTDTTLESHMKRWATIFAKIRVVAQNHPPAFWRFLRWLLLRDVHRTFGCRFPSVRKAIRRLKNVPMFFIHGEKDGFIQVSQSQMLYGLATDPKYLWIVPGAKHNQSAIVQPEQYSQRIVAFFDQHLAGLTDSALMSDTLSDLAQPLGQLPDQAPPPMKVNGIRAGARR